MRASVLIFAIHRTVDWWRFVGQHLGLGRSVVVTDLRGEGDISIVDDFYRALKRRSRDRVQPSPLFTEQETHEIIARCRTLRWLDYKLARNMVHAMAEVLDGLLESVQPAFVLSFPIDRYVKDVLERRATARGIHYLELTTAVFPNMSMFLRRGALVTLSREPNKATIELKRRELVDPEFMPSYVPRRARYTTSRFLRVFSYHRARSSAFKAISILKRDPLNLHYLDAQFFLGHKPRLADVKVLRLADPDWAATLHQVPLEKRVFFGLQLFPEASLDYWIANKDLIDYEEHLFHAARVFSERGYLLLIKDHPLQFGVRQRGLIERLLSLPNAVFLPYDVRGETVLQVCGINFSFTGTLGLQAALAGLKSIVTSCYYSNDRDFVVFRDARELSELPQRVETMRSTRPLESRQADIVAHLLRGSFEGNMFSFRKFSRSSPSPDAAALAASMGEFMRRLRVEGNDRNAAYEHSVQQ